MTKPKNLSENAIRDRVGDRSFSRGKNYFRSDAIFSARQQEDVLRASCQGSAPYPYQLWAKLDEEGIVTAECSCPVGGGGYCKHVAALLLTWIHRPDAFRESQTLEATLEARDKEDLILLIRQMLARYPDLEELIDAMPIRSTDSVTRVNADAIVRQVKQALSRFDYGHAHYQAAASIAGELSAILQLTDVYRERDEWQAVAQIACAVVDELVDSYAEVYDHDGELSMVLWEGSEALGGCLQHLKSADERRPILQTLVSIVTLDIVMGGYGFADDAYEVLLEMAMPDEKNEIATQIEDKLSSIADDDFGSNWKQQSLGRWLLNLRAETLSDEQYIDICRRSTLYAPLVDRFLALGRVDEAITETQSASDYELLTLADLFLQHGHGEIAEQLVWERTARSDDTRLDGWLKEYAVELEDWEQALTYAEAQFWRYPSIELYRAMLSIAEKLEQEEEQYKKVVTRLAVADRPQFGLLVRIHLHHGKIGEALTTHSQIPPKSPIGWIYGTTLDLELAKAAKETHPRDALQLYQNRIKRLIDARGRDNYATAAGLLKHVRVLYERLGEPDQWEAYLRNVRNQKPRLPALLDELKKAGL